MGFRFGGLAWRSGCAAFPAGGVRRLPALPDSLFLGIKQQPLQQRRSGTPIHGASVCFSVASRRKRTTLVQRIGAGSGFPPERRGGFPAQRSPLQGFQVQLRLGQVYWYRNFRKFGISFMLVPIWNTSLNFTQRAARPMPSARHILSRASLGRR